MVSFLDIPAYSRYLILFIDIPLYTKEHKSAVNVDVIATP